MIIMLTASNARMTSRESYNWGIAVWNRWSVFLLPCSLMWQNGSTVWQGSPLLSLNLCLYVLFFVTSSDFIIIVSSELSLSLQVIICQPKRIGSSSTVMKLCLALSFRSFCTGNLFIEELQILASNYCTTEGTENYRKLNFHVWL